MKLPKEKFQKLVKDWKKKGYIIDRIISGKVIYAKEVKA